MKRIFDILNGWPIAYGKKKSGGVEELNKIIARTTEDDEAEAQHRSLLARMTGSVRDEGRMNLREVVGTSVTLGFAGTETMTTTLTGLVFNLSQNASAYETLLGEVRSAFDSEDEISLHSTARLEYLDACIKESMRVYPPAPQMPPRVCPGEFISGRYVPPKTLLSVFPWATFRNPSHFVDAESFIPERWLSRHHPLFDPRFEQDNQSVFQPFSYGSRDCLGKNLAYAVMRLVLTRFLFRFDYKADPGHMQDGWQRQQRAHLVWATKPLFIRLEERKMDRKLTSS
ncbi:hypothetical protein CDD83_9599 [Cordyceps sp. RAO-2017]|nr:hypothetical protein CDD83_9599 [Cordyceps sp. RAO-2017]